MNRLPEAVLSIMKDRDNLPVKMNLEKGLFQLKVELYGSEKGFLGRKTVAIDVEGDSIAALADAVLNHPIVQNMLEELERNQQLAAKLQKELEEKQVAAAKNEQNAINLEVQSKAEANAAAVEFAAAQQKAQAAQARLQQRQQATQGVFTAGQAALAQRTANLKAQQAIAAKTGISTPTKSSFFGRFNPFGKKVVSSTARHRRSNRRNTRRRH